MSGMVTTREMLGATHVMRSVMSMLTDSLHTLRYHVDDKALERKMADVHQEAVNLRKDVADLINLISEMCEEEERY